MTQPQPPTYDELLAGLQAIGDLVRPHLTVGSVINGTIVADGVPASGPEVYALADSVFRVYAHTLNPSGYQEGFG